MFIAIVYSCYSYFDNLVTVEYLSDFKYNYKSFCNKEEYSQFLFVIVVLQGLYLLLQITDIIFQPLQPTNDQIFISSSGFIVYLLLLSRLFMFVRDYDHINEDDYDTYCLLTIFVAIIAIWPYFFYKVYLCQNYSEYDIDQQKILLELILNSPVKSAGFIITLKKDKYSKDYVYAKFLAKTQQMKITNVTKDKMEASAKEIVEKYFKSESKYSLDIPEDLVITLNKHYIVY